MKRKTGKRWLSLLMAAAVAFGGISVPAPAAAVAEAAAVTVSDDSREVNFNMDWKFNLGDVSSASQKSYNDSSWKDVTLPHDFSITQSFSASYEAESGYLPGGTGWYRKTFVMPAAYSGKSIRLNFDGVYNHAYVYVNGTKVGEHHYGYTNFAFDIGDLLTCDGTTENVIAVKAVNEFPSSRWYSGSGIYRDVTLTVTDPVHVAMDGTYVTTPNLESQQNGNVTVNVETTVQNDSSASVSATVRTTIQDADGNAVSTAVSASATVAAGKTSVVTQTPTVNKPELWSCENPALYYVKTEILVNGVVKDTYMTEFGFRYFKFDVNNGFYLNGEAVKLKGVCMHHDQGALGASAYYDAIYRQVQILKEMGCNSIRVTHNPASSDLISICNQEGILLVEEAFDGWSSAKNGNSKDFSVYFNTALTSDNQVLGGSTSKTWAQFTLESMLERDKNAPSIIMWSVGNELETGTSSSISTYPTIAQNLVNWIQVVDTTRPITVGDNANAFSNSSHIHTQVDTVIANAGGVIGLNYSHNNYANQHSAKPSWPLVASETASVSNSRGVYSTTDKLSSYGNYQCTAYDTLSVSWGAKARDSWYQVITKDYMAGEYVWTGFDYIGEPTPWNGTGTGSVTGSSQAVPNSSFFGIIDTAGFPKDSYYFYTSQWREDATTLHLVPGSWDEEELAVSNGYVPVYIYSNAAKVELYLNGTKIGTSTRTSTTTSAGYEYGTWTNTSNSSSVCTAVSNSGYNALSAQFNVKYAEGTLSAKAYDSSGKLISDTLGNSVVKTTSDDGTTLEVTADKTEMQADGQSLCYISVDIKDADGNFVNAADDNIRFTLTGNGTIVGVDNGNPSTVNKFQQASVLTSDTSANINAFHGKALVIVRSTEASGGFSVKAEATGLTGESVSVSTVGGETAAPYLQTYDLQTGYIVKMGNVPTLQTQVSGTMSDGSAVSGTVVWNSYDESQFDTPGTYSINGTLNIADESIPVVASVNVQPEIAAMLNYSCATAAGTVPKLPDSVSGVMPNGQVYEGNYPVVWESVSANDLDTVGDVVTVNGTAALATGESMPVTATIRVAEGNVATSVNVASSCSSLTESCSNPSDNLASIKDGVTSDFTSTDARWTNYNERLLNSDAAITFTWDTVQKLEYVKLYFFTDGYSASLPEKVRFEVSTNGTDYTSIDVNQPSSITSTSTFTFDSVQSVKGLRITLTEQSGHCVGLVECEIYTAAYTYDVYDTALLDTLTVDDGVVPGFVSGVYNSAGYTKNVSNAANAEVEATGLDNAAVTIVPVDDNNVVRVLAQAEDQSKITTYEITLVNSIEKADAALLASLNEEITKAKALDAEDYTDASYQTLAQAIAAAEELKNSSEPLKADVENMITAIQAAIENLEEAPVTPPGPELPDAELLAQLAAAITEAEGKEESSYTAESYAPFKGALDKAKEVQNTATSTKENVELALAELQEAMENLKEAPVTPPEPELPDETEKEMAEVKEQLTASLKDAESKEESQYTADSYEKLQQALKDVKEVQANDRATLEELKAALESLQKALSGLQAKSGGGTAVTPEVKLPEVGSVHVIGKGQYKITSVSEAGGTVTYMKPTKKTLKKVVIPATVKIQNITFKVTAIAAKALKNNKKLVKVTVGKNVEMIGKSAFAGDKKLKKIVVKSASIKKVGKKALKGIRAKCKIKVPKKSLKTYKRLFKKKGQKASVKITK